MRTPAEPPVVWDLDGTLVRLGVDPAAIVRWKEALAQRFPRWRGGFSPLLPSLEAALADAAVALPAEKARALRMSVYQNLDTWEETALGAVEVLVPTADRFLALATTGRPMALVSNNGGPAVSRGLDALTVYAAARGLPPPALAAVVCRGPDLPAKPDPAMLRCALTRLQSASGGANPDALAVVGDQPGDAEAAARLSSDLSMPVRFFNVGPGADRATTLVPLGEVSES